MSQLITDCPHCATRFRLTPEQLEMANGLVRCGKCVNVFNAGENSLGAESSEIESSEIESSEIEGLGTEGLGTEGLGTEDSGTKNPITPKQEIDNQTEDTTPLPAMTELLHNEFAVQQPPTKDRTSKPFLAKLLLILAGTLLLTAQYSYFFSRELSQTEAYRKPLASFCQHLGCTLELFRDIDRLRVRQFMVHSHPSQPGALTVDLTIQNLGLFDQPLPKIALRFANMQNQTVARRLLTASEYLSQGPHGSQSLAAKSKLIPSGKQRRVNFSLLDPGVSAVNYSVELKE